MSKYTEDMCLDRHPDRACLCTLPAGHDLPHYSEPADAVWAVPAPACGAAHPYRRTLTTCARPDGHRGPHETEDQRVRWSR